MMTNRTGAFVRSFSALILALLLAAPAIAKNPYTSGTIGSSLRAAESYWRARRDFF